jgi:hypothetical protein
MITLLNKSVYEVLPEFPNSTTTTLPTTKTVSNTKARYAVPPLKFPVGRSFSEAEQTVRVWNNFFADSFEGVGFYAANPQSDIEDPTHEHYILMADDEFMGHFDESVEEVEYQPIQEESFPT